MALAPESALRSLLVSDGDVSALVGTRVVPRGNVSTTAGRPYVSYQRISTDNAHHMTAAAGVQTIRVQLDIVADTFAAAVDIAEKCRLAADGYRGTVNVSGNTLDVKHCHLEDQQDAPTNPQAGREHATFVINQDWVLAFPVSVPTFS